jgi:hypothetical protein
MAHPHGLGSLVPEGKRAPASVRGKLNGTSSLGRGRPVVFVVPHTTSL